MTYDEVLAALADPTRRAIFERLQGGPRAVVDLARGLPVSRPAVSQHLKVLKEAGLVTDQRDGARRVYRLNPEGLGALRAYLDRFWSQALTAFTAAAEHQAAEHRAAEHRAAEHRTAEHRTAEHEGDRT